ncbi:hypothetical protein DVF89_22915 [Salmonella enterica subsp. enterica]|nr:hypothetical protein [Salmonella enterica subsp. enterica serovar Kinondoni]
MLSKTGFTHSDLLCWQIDYAGGSLNVNGTIMRNTYNILKVKTVQNIAAGSSDNIIKVSHCLSALLYTPTGKFKYFLCWRLIWQQTLCSEFPVFYKLN